MKKYQIKEIIAQAKYPILNSKDYLEIVIGKPEPDPKSTGGDHFCPYKITAPQYNKEVQIYGIDSMQSLWLALRAIKSEILSFEKQTKLKCSYSTVISFVRIVSTSIMYSCGVRAESKKFCPSTHFPPMRFKREKFANPFWLQ